MPLYTIDIGAAPNDGTGDPLRTAFNETNLNFDQVFTAGPVLSNVRIANNTILTTTTNGNLILAPNGTAVVQSNVHIVPNTSNIRNLGSADRRWATVFAQYIETSQINLANNLSVSGQLTVNSIASSDSAFVTVDDGLDVQGTITAESVLATLVTTQVLLFAALPAAAASQGLRAMISNANLVAVGNFGQTVTGGGANTVPVYSDGAVYRIG